MREIDHGFDKLRLPGCGQRLMPLIRKTRPNRQERTVQQAPASEALGSQHLDWRTLAPTSASLCLRRLADLFAVAVVLWRPRRELRVTQNAG
jgi:hypothetical protein